MEMKNLALEAAKILDKKGATEITILDVSHMTSITDYFIIVSGRNVQAVHTLAEDLEDHMQQNGIQAHRRDGSKDTKWIVLDYSGVIVHIFHPDERRFYNIERLWEDGTNQVEFIPEED